jgi:hypothetical protein
MLFKLGIWNGFCGFVLSQSSFPSSAAGKGRREAHRKKLTFPGFMFYWKEALYELNSHGLWQ